MESYVYRQKKPVFFITDASLFLVGLGLYLSGLSLEPTEELKFLQSDLGSIYTIPKHILAFGFILMVISLYGLYGLLADTKFYFRYVSAILFIMLYELGIIAKYLIMQRIQAWYINAEILEISGSASFAQYLRQSNFTSVKPSLIRAENNMENVRLLHSYFKCCSGFKYNAWRPLFPNYICCKPGVTIPCTLQDSYEDRCDRKLLIYAWKLYRYYVIICGAAFAFQSIVLGIIIYLYYLELKHEVVAKKKKQF